MIAYFPCQDCTDARREEGCSYVNCEAARRLSYQPAARNHECPSCAASLIHAGPGGPVICPVCRCQYEVRLASA